MANCLFVVCTLKNANKKSTKRPETISVVVNRAKNQVARLCKTCHDIHTQQKYLGNLPILAKKLIPNITEQLLDEMSHTACCHRRGAAERSRHQSLFS